MEGMSPSNNYLGRLFINLVQDNGDSRSTSRNVYTLSEIPLGLFLSLLVGYTCPL